MEATRTTPGGPAAVMAAMAVAVSMTTAAPLRAKVFMTQAEALKAAFPDGTDVERITAYLTEDQAGKVERALGESLASRVITYYVARRDGILLATAYFDTHLVRTLPETIMVVVGKSATIEKIHVLSFSEPVEYLPRERWIAQLDGRGIRDDLSLRGDIRPMTGATLSARAIVKAARRILAIHDTLSSTHAEKDGAGPRRER